LIYLPLLSFAPGATYHVQESPESGSEIEGEMSRRTSKESVAQCDPLDSRLSGYSAGAKLAAAASRLRSRTGNWPVYAAAAGSALAMTTSASASIISGVYNGPSPDGGVSVRTTLNTTGVLPSGPQLLLRAVKGTGSVYGPFAALSVQAFSPLSIFAGGPFGLYVKNFSRSAPISSAAGVLTQGAKVVASATLNSGVELGSFLPGEPGYAGFAINSLGGNRNYGWLKLEFLTDPNTQLPQILEALAWGLETTPNAAIKAGDTGPAPTPEPGTMALSILAAGAAGVAALRRRRQQSA
jgi:hypothetical protein